MDSLNKLKNTWKLENITISLQYSLLFLLPGNLAKIPYLRFLMNTELTF